MPRQGLKGLSRGLGWRGSPGSSSSSPLPATSRTAAAEQSTLAANLSNRGKDQSKGEEMRTESDGPAVPGLAVRRPADELLVESEIMPSVARGTSERCDCAPEGPNTHFRSYCDINDH